MHEYFGFLKKDAYFYFIGLIVFVIISLFAFALFGGRTNDNDVVSDEGIVSENVNYNN